MAIVQPTTGGKAPVIDDDIYTVTCTEVQEIHLEEPDQFGKTEKLQFRIVLNDIMDEEGEPIFLDPRCNRAWSERATLFKWAQAFGLDVDPTQPIDTDQFVGMEARADIRTEAAGKWPKVNDFLPLPKGKRAPLAVVAEPDFDGFWKRVRAGGFERKDVAPYVDGDLATVSRKSQAELNTILEQMGA